MSLAQNQRRHVIHTSRVINSYLRQTCTWATRCLCKTKEVEIKSWNTWASLWKKVQMHSHTSNNKTKLKEPKCGMALTGAFIFNQAKPEQWCITWLKLTGQYDHNSWDEQVAWATKQLKVKRQIAQVKLQLAWASKQPIFEGTSKCLKPMHKYLEPPTQQQNKPLIAASNIYA